MRTLAAEYAFDSPLLRRGRLQTSAGLGELRAPGKSRTGLCPNKWALYDCAAPAKSLEDRRLLGVAAILFSVAAKPGGLWYRSEAQTEHRSTTFFCQVIHFQALRDHSEPNDPNYYYPML